MVEVNWSKKINNLTSGGNKWSYKLKQTWWKKLLAL